MPLVFRYSKEYFWVGVTGREGQRKYVADQTPFERKDLFFNDMFLGEGENHRYRLEPELGECGAVSGWYLEFIECESRYYGLCEIEAKS